MLTIGADPELFLFHTEEQKHVCAIGKLPGSKLNPFTVGNGAIQVDNMAAEFNIGPARSADEFNYNVGEMMDILSKGFEEHGCVISQESVVEFDDDQFYHPDAYVAGCDPDYSVWNTTATPDFSATKLRCAGGHIHIGCGELTSEELSALIKVLDVYVTLPFLHLEDPRRRALYGGAGAYRVKPYGVEYRTPSNIWIFDPTMREEIFNKTTWCVENFRDLVIEETIPHIINKHDLDAAKVLLNK